MDILQKVNGADYEGHSVAVEITKKKKNSEGNRGGGSRSIGNKSRGGSGHSGRRSQGSSNSGGRRKRDKRRG